jgi:hypothetical protein
MLIPMIYLIEAPVYLMETPLYLLPNLFHYLISFATPQRRNQA